MHGNSFVHEQQFIDCHCPSGEKRLGAMPAPTNQAAVFITNSSGVKDDWPHHLWFNGELIEIHPGPDALHCVINFDSTLVATSCAESEPSKPVTIAINGVTTYQLPPNYDLYQLQWISNHELVWRTMPQHNLPNWKSLPMLTFRNGVDVTDNLLYEPYFGGMIEVIDYAVGVRYRVSPQGKVYGQRAIDPSEPRAHSVLELRLPSPEEREAEHALKKLKPQVTQKQGNAYVTHRGIEGPHFAELEQYGGLHNHVLSPDGSMVAYTGVTYQKTLDRLSRFLGRCLEYLEQEERYRKWWVKILGFPIVLLYNPYFGVVYMATKISKRHVIATQHGAWSKSYFWVSTYFFTPQNHLVALVNDSDWRVVIDDVEGPAFDEIQNLHYNGDTQTVSYLANDGTDYFSVSVVVP